MMEQNFKAIVRRELHTSDKDSITYFSTQEEAMEYVTNAIIHPHADNPMLEVGIESYDGECWQDLGVTVENINPYDIYSDLNDLNCRHGQLLPHLVGEVDHRKIFSISEGHYELLDEIEDDELRAKAERILERCDAAIERYGWISTTDSHQGEAGQFLNCEGESVAEEIGTNQYHYNYNNLWLSIQKTTSDGEKEIAFLQGDEAIELADSLDTMSDSSIQIALSEYDFIEEDAEAEEMGTNFNDYWEV